MGVDFLDFTLHIEKAFSLKSISRDEVAGLFSSITERKLSDVTAGELHQWVVSILKRRGLSIPFSSWTRIRLALARTVGKQPQSIHKDTLIRRDLDFH
jgi:hypothetical protein